SRTGAVALVQRIMDADYVSDDGVAGLLGMLEAALACPTGHVSDLIFWSAGRELSAEDVVDEALGYQPIAL
ncbi:MAG TPA: e9imm peptide, partial [Streptomyces sp.]